MPHQAEISFRAQDEVGDECIDIVPTLYTKDDPSHLGSNPDHDVEEQQRVSRANFDGFEYICKEHTDKEKGILGLFYH